MNHGLSLGFRCGVPPRQIHDGITTVCRPLYIPAMPRIHGGRPPLLSVLAAALHLPIVGTWRTRKALGVPYDGPRWGDFYEPRVTRGDVVILRLLPRSGI